MTFKDKPKRPAGKTLPRKAPTKPGSEAAPKATKATKVVEAAGDAKAERISKIMARAGVASRRDVERMIMEGRVTLNGKVLDTPVVNVTLADRIEVDGAPIRGIERTRLWLYHKPAGLVTTNSDPEGRPTVFDNLPDGLPRVMSIGRLDINTEGLLLLTNDGGLARVLELPATGWLRRYRVRAHGDIDQEKLDGLKEGIAVDGVLYGSIEATLDRKQGSNVWITMSLREGKNREIKNVLGVLGLDVNRLIRISYGPFQLGDLPEGQAVEVRGRTLRDQLGPRLIEEAKANFDAPLYGSEAAVGEAQAAEEPAAPRERPQRDERPRQEDRPNKPDRPGRPDRPGKQDRREKALGRLDTKRDPSRSEDDRPKKPKTLGTRRSVNVWMAPGARPLGEKAAAKAAKNEQTARRRGDDRNARPQVIERDRAPSRVLRVQEEDGEWIRSQPTPRRDEEPGRDGDRKRSFRDRPPREEGAASRPERSRDPSRSDKPAKAGFGKSAFGKPGAGKANSDKPNGGKPSYGKPSFGKSSSGKPSGAKGGAKPGSGGRDDRPAGGASRGGVKGKGPARGADRRR